MCQTYGMNGESSQGEVIDLESLVKDLSSSEGASQLGAEQLDTILFSEAPEMAEQQNELRANQIKPSEEQSPDSESGPQTLDQELAPETWRSRIAHRWAFARLKAKHALLSLKQMIVRGGSDFRGLVVELSLGLKARSKIWLTTQKERVKNAFSQFRRMSTRARLMFLFALLMIGSAIGFAGWLIRTGGLFHKTLPWVSSLEPLASETLGPSELEAVEDFYDPLHYPEFTVIVERIVVNLKPESRESSEVLPMAAFELFLQTENQDAAIEVKNRMVEIRDAVSREAEAFTRRFLAVEQGKERLKTKIRKAVNDRLQTGRVRRVYFRTFVLSSSAMEAEDEQVQEGLSPQESQ